MHDYGVSRLGYVALSNARCHNAHMTMQPNVDPRFTLDFADRLLLAQRRSGLGVQELAERLEVSRNAISSWINGHNRPRTRDLKAFALATGYPVRWLESGEVPSDGPDGGGAEWAPWGSNPRPADYRVDGSATGIRELRPRARELAVA